MPQHGAFETVARESLECEPVGERLELRLVVGEVIPAVARQHLRGGRIAENAWHGLLKDAVARQRAQDAVQRVGVDAPLARELGAASRARRERPRHTQVGGEPQRAGNQRTPQRVPDHPLGVHPRAAWTAAVASSSSIRRNDRARSPPRPNPQPDCELGALDVRRQPSRPCRSNASVIESSICDAGPCCRHSRH